MSRQTMQAKYIQIVSDSTSTLARAVERGGATHQARRGMTLGEDNRALFLAHCGVANIEEAWAGAKVVARTKRSAIVRIGDLHLFLNRFGVATYLLPMETPMGSFNFSQHSLLDSGPLLSAVDAVHDGYDRKDPVYSYRACCLSA